MITTLLRQYDGLAARLWIHGGSVLVLFFLFHRVLKLPSTWSSNIFADIDPASAAVMAGMLSAILWVIASYPSSHPRVNACAAAYSAICVVLQSASTPGLQGIWANGPIALAMLILAAINVEKSRFERSRPQGFVAATHPSERVASAVSTLVVAALCTLTLLLSRKASKSPPR